MNKAYPETLGPEDVLFFLHIPKTAGTSLTQTLTARWGPEVTLTPDQMNTAKFQPKEVMAACKFLYGHYNRTMCERRLVNPPTFTFTFLRDPIAHYLSVFHHLQRDENFGYTTRVTRGDREMSRRIATIARDKGLDAFLDAAEPRIFDNFQTKYLVDGMRFLPNLEETDALLEEAMVCLNELGIFGITDRYDESLGLFNRALNLTEPLETFATNAAPNRSVEALNGHQLEEIRSRTRYDQRLYDYAVAIFETRLQVP